MSQRVEKVESLVLSVVARQLLEALQGDSARVTVTAVEVTPDLRHATVWLGILADAEQQRQELFEAVLDAQHQIQRELAASMTTKFTPKLNFRLDGGGKYADHINSILKNL